MNVTMQQISLAALATLTLVAPRTVHADSAEQTDNATAGSPAAKASLVVGEPSRQLDPVEVDYRTQVVAENVYNYYHPQKKLALFEHDYRTAADQVYNYYHPTKAVTTTAQHGTAAQHGPPMALCSKLGDTGNCCASGDGCDCCGGCGCGNGVGCGHGVGGGDGLVEAWKLQSALLPESALDFGGWSNFGYHSNNTRQSFVDNDMLAYNDLPGRLNVHQAWFYFGKKADGSRGFDLGFRVDALYGTDAQKTQATGTRAAQIPGNGQFDASWDHGIYGWAMPQLYGEVASGDWSAIYGYFISPIGYEFVQAPNNFFYSHSLTMFNSEPFTHTGFLAAYEGFEGLKIYGGWTLGWDTAFVQELGGSAYLGGFSLEMGDFATFTYLATIGDFGWRGDDGYNHGIVLELFLTDRLEYAVQSDYVRTQDTFDTVGLRVEEFGINQYLYYQLTERLWIGGRAEWWKSSGPTGNHQSYYEITGGVNFQMLPNVVFRPEMRYDWTPAEDAFAAAVAPNYNEAVFGVDCVMTF